MGFMFKSIKFFILVIATILPLIELGLFELDSYNLFEESLLELVKYRVIKLCIFAFLASTLSYQFIYLSSKLKQNLFELLILSISFKYVVFLSLLWITFLPGLRDLVVTALKSVRSILYVTILLGLHFYIYGVIGVNLFSETDPTHFGKIQNSLVALFQVLTLEDWTDVMFAQISNPAEITLIPVLFFVSFVLIGTILILNLLVAIVTNAFVSAKLELEMSSLKAVNQQSFDKISNSIEQLSEKLEQNQDKPRLKLINGGLNAQSSLS